MKEAQGKIVIDRKMIKTSTVGNWKFEKILNIHRSSRSGV
jgi:hypothetical protein